MAWNNERKTEGCTSGDGGAPFHNACKILLGV